MEPSVHYRCDKIVKKVEGLFHIIPLDVLRHTENVDFNIMPLLPEFNGIDVVTHAQGAHSPGSVGEQHDLWYMHTGQEDNLVTLHGSRDVELYTKEHGKVEKFQVSPQQIKWNGEVVFDGPAIIGWPTEVFHRNSSPEGSVSMNFAVRTSKFNIDTEFNIYTLDTSTGSYEVARLGKLDQPNNK